jgi:hypothetical protein
MFDQKVYDRLLKRTRKDESGCWLWTGPVKGSKWPANRYGCFAIYRGGKRVEQNTHRSMWYALHGKAPKGMCVCHRCDVPTCVNPDHLWLGTKLDNTMDMVRKKRHHLNRLTHCKRGHPLSGDNLYVQPQGYRSCKECKRIQMRDRWRTDPSYRARLTARRRERYRARINTAAG